uniref:DUF659 domain-containing protein n=1 Tax=Chenopodium quinoa TaxID=63459 RepID=A0A803NCW0_CHEQI
MLSNRVLLQQLRKKVEDAEHDGVSPSLTRSTVNIKTTVATSSPIEKSLEFGEMCKALNHAPKDYKPPSADRAITSLLDDCKREIEKECAPVKDTWVTQGTSIVSDGWTNVKHKALMNVIASNSRGLMFLYAEDFSGMEKTGKAIADFLLTSIDEVGPSNVL